MKASFKLLIIGLVQYLLMCLFVLYLPTKEFIAFDIVSFSIKGSYSKWNELVFLLIPLLILFGHFLESYLNNRSEKITGSPYRLKKVVLIVCEILFITASLYCWSGLIIQKQFSIDSNVSHPIFFIITFLFSIGLIYLGKYLLKVIRGDTVGFNIPFLTRDHSIWRRVNSLIGRMLIISGFFFIIIMIIYELILNALIPVVGGIIILILVVVIPLIYCIYLNNKAKKL